MIRLVASWHCLSPVFFPGKQANWLEAELGNQPQTPTDHHRSPAPNFTGSSALVTAMAITLGRVRRLRHSQWCATTSSSLPLGRMQCHLDGTRRETMGHPCQSPEVRHPSNDAFGIGNHFEHEVHCCANASQVIYGRMFILNQSKWKFNASQIRLQATCSRAHEYWICPGTIPRCSPKPVHSSKLSQSSQSR